jgi:chemotaxis signal transduction protein
VFDSTALGGASETASTQASKIILVKQSDVCFALSLERHLTVTSLAAAERSEEHDDPAECQGRDLLEAALAHEGDVLLVLSLSRIAAAVRGAFGDLMALEESDADEAIDVAAEGQFEAPRFLCVSVGHVRLALPIDRIIEIVEGHEVTPLFNVPPSLRGLINVRGQVIACFDMSQDFALPPRILEERSPFVILDGDGRELALCVDHICGIRPFEPEQQHTDTIWRGEFVHYVDRLLEVEEGTLLFVSVPDVFKSPHLQVH